MTADEIKERLKSVKYPGFSRDIVSFGLIKEIEVDAEAHADSPPRRHPERRGHAQDRSTTSRHVSLAVPGLPPPDIVVERPPEAAEPRRPERGLVMPDAGRAESRESQSWSR